MKRTVRFSCCAEAQIAANIPFFGLRVVDRACVGRAVQHFSFAGGLIQVINRASGSACMLSERLVLEPPVHIALLGRCES